MNPPTPPVLFLGGLALIQVSMMILGLHAAAWARYTGTTACIALGLVSLGLGLQRQFGKKKAKPKFVSKRERERQKREG
jgi:hypothetical protein